jgi:transketolase
VLPEDIPTLSVEAPSPNGLHRQVGMESFGYSVPGDKVYEYFGFSADHIADKGRQLVQFYEETPQ